MTSETNFFFLMPGETNFFFHTYTTNKLFFSLKSSDKLFFWKILSPTPWLSNGSSLSMACNISLNSYFYSLHRHTSFIWLLFYIRGQEMKIEKISHLGFVKYRVELHNSPPFWENSSKTFQRGVIWSFQLAIYPS